MDPWFGVLVAGGLCAVPGACPEMIAVMAVIAVWRIVLMVVMGDFGQQPQAVALRTDMPLQRHEMTAGQIRLVALASGAGDLHPGVIIDLDLETLYGRCTAIAKVLRRYAPERLAVVEYQAVVVTAMFEAVVQAFFFAETMNEVQVRLVVLNEMLAHRVIAG